MAQISIVGLFNFDNTIFDNMRLPNEIDKDVLIFNLLLELGELEILYPDADFLKKMIEMWSAKELPIWQKMYNTTVLEYNPIENYDRKEEWTDNNSGHAVSRVAAFNESNLVPSGDGDTDTNSTHSGRAHGNIGVTTTQQLIEKERRVAEFTTIDYIIQRFKQRFCITVY